MACHVTSVADGHLSASARLSRSSLSSGAGDSPLFFSAAPSPYPAPMMTLGKKEVLHGADTSFFSRVRIMTLKKKKKCRTALKRLRRSVVTLLLQRVSWG
jgi:hypothetical protein